MTYDEDIINPSTSFLPSTLPPIIPPSSAMLPSTPPNSHPSLSRKRKTSPLPHTSIRYRGVDFAILDVLCVYKQQVSTRYRTLFRLVVRNLESNCVEEMDIRKDMLNEKAAKFVQWVDTRLEHYWVEDFLHTKKAKSAALDLSAPPQETFLPPPPPLVSPVVVEQPVEEEPISLPPPALETLEETIPEASPQVVSPPVAEPVESPVEVDVTIVDKNPDFADEQCPSSEIYHHRDCWIIEKLNFMYSNPKKKALMYSVDVYRKTQPELKCQFELTQSELRQKAPEFVQWATDRRDNYYVALKPSAKSSPSLSQDTYMTSSNTIINLVEGEEEMFVPEAFPNDTPSKEEKQDVDYVDDTEKKRRKRGRPRKNSTNENVSVNPRPVAPAVAIKKPQDIKDEHWEDVMTGTTLLMAFWAAHSSR